MASIRVRSNSATRRRSETGSTGMPSGGYGSKQSLPLAPADPIKDAVAGVASPALAGAVSRPSSRGATRRRPAPKVITEGAVQMSNPGSPLHGSVASESKRGLAGVMGVSELLASPLRPTLPKDKDPEASQQTPAKLVASPSPSEPSSSPKIKGSMDSENGPNGYCTISTEPDGVSEIRTKVFRIGAPLLRSTIPVILGSAPRAKGENDVPELRPRRGKSQSCDDDGSDVETILSLSDQEDAVDGGQLSVTLDFPC
eukprot:CAMPEP_0197659392 /NCGR_PEP_ID=MMETSP1338-20131121/47486_1 /TAXON_ID=43686 ORGANISM="Pelagodinium beii, Strain RCC1491" /NCGR_SAMPLE_ID=MMETSP1338 /ASSEMBLY_ACC=CAM_ASM_000754 /LENGTH=255 /DNA_ID=CAMNT_0043236293 /DNA_START=24 /DNA_END=791 /DNA_ORIENTATION=-